jgi:lysophospholipase L1-like esterase
MILLASFAMIAELSATAAEVQVNHHTGGRTLKDEEVETESAIFTPFETYQWPGTYFETAFTGRRLVLSFKYQKQDRYKLYIDDQLYEVIAQPNLYFFVSGLKSGKHTARLEKLSESQDGSESFYGFGTQGKGKISALPPRVRQIEFIGDSYTVGYGNTSGKHQCTPEEVRVSTDTQMAYGPLTAKHFDADYQINAVSGRGIVRNYDGFAGDTLPELYPYVLFDKQTRNAHDTWKPQVIVIGLGGNDFSTPVKPGEKWADDAALKVNFETTYVAFVKDLRAQNPRALIVLTKYEGPVVAAEVERVGEALKAGGDTRITTIGMDDFSKNGCDWHLDIDDDKRIAQQLIAYLGGVPELPRLGTVPTIVDPGIGPIPAPAAEDLLPLPAPEPAIGEPLNLSRLQPQKSDASTN